MSEAAPQQLGASVDEDRFLNDPLLPFVQEDYFSLGLVVNWPACRNAQQQQQQSAYNPCNYQSFLSAVEAECFPTTPEILRFLPFHALHITIATFCAAAPTTQTALQHAKKWKTILQRASASPHWPRHPLELEMDSAAIRNRAGILLWREHTGGLANMRKCIRDAVVQGESLTPSFLQDFKIPDICHTTFVRYQQCAASNSWTPSQANACLLETVVPNQALFSKTNGSSSHQTKSMVVATVASLVDCKIYLLGQEPDHEIFLSLPLQEEEPQDD